MIRIFILVCVVLLNGCATRPRPWARQEKILLATSCLASAADAYTTIRFLDNDSNYEVNPWLGEHPTDRAVIISMVGVNALVILLVHYIPSWRVPVLGAKTVLNTGFTINNLTLDW